MVRRCGLEDGRRERRAEAEGSHKSETGAGWAEEKKAAGFVPPANGFTNGNVKDIYVRRVAH